MIGPLTTMYACIYVLQEFFIVMRNYFNLRSWFENLSSVDTSRQVGNSDQIEAKELKGSTTIIWQVWQWLKLLTRILCLCY